MPASTLVCEDCEITGDQLYTRPIAAKDCQVFVAHGLHCLNSAKDKTVMDRESIYDATDVTVIEWLSEYSQASDLDLSRALSIACENTKSKRDITSRYFTDSDADWDLGQRLGTGSMTDDELWEATAIVVDKLLAQINPDGLLTLTAEEEQNDP